MEKRNFALKKGKLLNENIIDKLLNFGVYEVNVNIDNEDFEVDEIAAIEKLKSNFIETQKYTYYR
ncbi:MAG: hypothetical protein MZV70_01540 [Desulfobacterales bacterium]|nr:hypothetical protein [Desulfobacterales bacterium]